MNKGGRGRNVGHQTSPAQIRVSEGSGLSIEAFCFHIHLPLIFVPLIEITFEGIVSWITFETVVATATVAAASVVVYQIDSALDIDDNKDVALVTGAIQEEPEEKSAETERKKRKKHTPEQEALSELVSASEKIGISNPDADVLLEWAKEYDYPSRDYRGKDHWIRGEHIHLGGKHVPVRFNG